MQEGRDGFETAVGAGVDGITKRTPARFAWRGLSLFDGRALFSGQRAKEVEVFGPGVGLSEIEASAIRLEQREEGVGQGVQRHAVARAIEPR